MSERIPIDPRREWRQRFLNAHKDDPSYIKRILDIAIGTVQEHPKLAAAAGAAAVTAVILFEKRKKFGLLQRVSLSNTDQKTNT